jgi:phosphatidate cytidylyltransferase
LVAALLAWLFPIPLQPGYALFVGLLGGVLALLGDLSISMLKRQVGVKDSGRLFPGHGGMLDRMDSLLFVLPMLYMVVSFFSLR